MAKAIKIRKGLNINIKGKAEERILETENPELFAIKPTDFPGLVPKMVLKEGAKVKVGTIVFHDKYNESIKYVSPVSGELKEILRGEKRKILALIFKADKEYQFETIDTSGDTKEVILKSGLWPAIKQRPLDKVASPNSSPKAIFVSGFDSHPLAPNYEYLLRGNEKQLQAGFDALAKLTKGKVNVTIHNSDISAGVFAKLSGIELNSIIGPHPAGNVGTHIHHINPVNKGETVWTVNALDVLRIGVLFTTGQLDLSKTIAVTGSEIKTPAYYKTWQGACLASVLTNNIEGDNVRVISGNVLTGTTVKKEGFLGFYDNQITVIPEGDNYRFFLKDGWLSFFNFNKLSANSAYLSSKLKNKKFDVDTNTNGEERAFVVTGQYEQVFPFNIYPVQLLKSVITNDIDGMENLGIYEIAPEDFALCEFVCSSKINSQEIIRKGLAVIEEECM
jgi:Na+-transporting NADH:ubiquinone oxidoreductase subunit A